MVGGCPAVVAQYTWQSTGGSSQRCPGFDSRRLPAFFTFLYLRLITSNFIYFQLEARYSQHGRYGSMEDFGVSNAEFI